MRPLRLTARGTAFFAVLLSLVFAASLYRDLAIGAAAGILAVVAVAEAAWNIVVARSPGRWMQLLPRASGQDQKAVLYPGDESVKEVRLVKKVGGRVELESTVNFQSIAPGSVSRSGVTPLELRFSTPYAGEYVGRQVKARVSGPWGLFSSEASLPFDQEYVVYPRILQIAMATLRLLGRGELGETPVDMPGIGTEFYEMREYQPSDDYRDVNWKASARGREMFVVEHMREVEGGYLLVLDTRARGFADRDALASTFLSLANALASAGVGFEVVVHDGEKVVSASAGSGPREALELALRAALEQTRLVADREVLELARSRQRVDLGEKDPVLSGLLRLRTLQDMSVVGKVSPWSRVLEHVRDGSTRDVVWVSGLFGDIAPLVELAWQARHYHDLQFAVADPCAQDGEAGPEGRKGGLGKNQRAALSSAGVGVYFGEPLAIAQKVVAP